MASQLNFVLCPLMAQGHMIPLMDIARILAEHDVYVTIITTHFNASRSVSAMARSCSRIRLAEVQFPYREAGLPQGCEDLDMLPSLGSSLSFFNASNTLQDQVEEILKDLTPPPSCIISDMSLPYTANVAKKFHIPRVSFLGQSCFTLFCLHNLGITQVLRNIASEDERFVLPCIPHRIEMTKAQIPGQRGGTSSSKGDEQGWREFYARTAEAEGSTYGVVMNSFEELEAEYAKGYKDAKNGKVWCIGPVSLINKDQLGERGKKASIDEHYCMNWLELKEPASVIYCCLGSMSNLTTLQMVELGLGLEASGRAFIWVIREGNNEELRNWLEEDGFERRNKDKGLVIKGWAPQVLILSHPAVGGFLTHCGWNSTLEAICAGVPLVTWPLFGDQFFNEKLIVEVLKIGVSVGVENPVEKGVLMKKGSVERAIEELMDETSYQERRERVKGLGEKAKMAVEPGGSSHSNVRLFIQDIMMVIQQNQE